MQSLLLVLSFYLYFSTIGVRAETTCPLLNCQVSIEHAATTIEIQGTDYECGELRAAFQSDKLSQTVCLEVNETVMEACHCTIPESNKSSDPIPETTSPTTVQTLPPTISPAPTITASPTYSEGCDFGHCLNIAKDATVNLLGLKYNCRDLITNRRRVAPNVCALADTVREECGCEAYPVTVSPTPAPTRVVNTLTDLRCHLCRTSSPSTTLTVRQEEYTCQELFVLGQNGLLEDAQCRAAQSQYPTACRCVDATDAPTSFGNNCVQTWTTAVLLGGAVALGW